MSAMHHEAHEGRPEGRPEEPTDLDPTRDTTALAPRSVVVRRNAGLAAAVGAAASAVAIAYLWRAVQGGSPLDWALCAVIALLAGFHLSGLLDARTPLVVADELGVRIRLGAQWRGLPWDAVAAVEVQPRRGLLRDGRLVFRPHSLERALDGLETQGRRSARLNQKMYGAPLAVPLGLTTRTSGTHEGLADDLAALAHGRATVELLMPTPAEEAAPAQPLDADEAVETPADEPAVLSEADRGRRARRAARRHPRRRHRRRGPARTTAQPGRQPRHDRLPGRQGPQPRRGRRRRRRSTPSPWPRRWRRQPSPYRCATPAAACAPRSPATRPPPRSAPPRCTRTRWRASAGLPESRELRRPGSVDLVFERVPAVSLVEGTVRPISRLGDPVEPLVIDDLAAEPAVDPVIGPELAAARTRVGLSVDELAERTRIRPHVIESIEVDDFAPCGGDFYARGHLRTLARVLGQDPAPLLERFDNRYATAPINARRVFEAELATGMTGSMRSTVGGGPNWALLVGVVLSLVLVWGVVRLFATETPGPDESLLPSPTPVLNGSAGVDREFPGSGGGLAANAPGRRLPVTLVATQAGSRVVVRDGQGQVVFAGPLVIGERKSLKVHPPVRVQARNAGAIEVQVRGKDRGPVGELGEPGRRTFTRTAR